MIGVGTVGPDLNIYAYYLGDKHYIADGSVSDTYALDFYRRRKFL